jgi:hypothetical protein
MPDVPNPMDEDPVTRSTEQARQGETSGRMRPVLGISLLVAIVAVVGLALDWRESHMAPQEPVTPPATNAQPDSTPNVPQPHGQVPGDTTPTPPNDQGNN